VEGSASVPGGPEGLSVPAAWEDSGAEGAAPSVLPRSRGAQMPPLCPHPYLPPLPEHKVREAKSCRWILSKGPLWQGEWGYKEATKVQARLQGGRSAGRLTTVWARDRGVRRGQSGIRGGHPGKAGGRRCLRGLQAGQEAWSTGEETPLGRVDGGRGSSCRSKGSCRCAFSTPSPGRSPCPSNPLCRQRRSAGPWLRISNSASE
jgi:hypothetical protein